MTSTAKVTRYERLQPRNWSLPVKLAAVLLVPVLLGLGLGVARIADHTHQATSLAAVDRFVVLDGKATAVIGRLQAERDQASVFVQNNRTGDRDAIQTLFGNTDGDVTELTTAVGDPASMGGAGQTAYQQAKDALDRITDLRNKVTGNGVQAPEVIAQYAGLIEPMLVFQAALDRQLNTQALAGPAAALTALGVAREQVALQHAVIAVAIARAQMLPADADTVRATDAQLGAAVDEFRAALNADQQSRYAGFTSDAASGQRQQLKQTALSRVGARGQLGISPADWDNAYNSVTEDMRTSADGLRGDVAATSLAQQDAARNASGIDSVILLLTLLAAATVVFLVGRSMLKPLRLLRTTALDIAERRLPKAVARMRAGETVNVAVEPVPVTSIEEIGQVARAFDEVHGQAVKLAAEQASLQTNVGSMFVNLSRRSQGLVERQLQLIEQLERNEQDAEQLSNLFQLDHLATRMRRNSENLLVLAGSDLAKRGSQPVPVVDVLRAAVSEIEQYQRVVVQQPPEASVAGRAASDMVHLVAELLDNATAFSAPDTQVVVSSSLTPGGTVLVEIADQGVGMPGEELVAANNRLSGPSEVDVSASRRMGLFVVGRLATRHGVGVRLASTDQMRGTGAGNGITASVNVPSALVVTADAGRAGAGRADAATGDRFGATVADRIGSTNAVGPIASTGAVTRAGLAPTGASNGTPVNGAGFAAAAAANGTGFGANPANGTGFGAAVTGANRVPSDSESGPPPRRSAPAEPSTPGGLPRRSAGATIGGTSTSARPEAPSAGRPEQAPHAAELTEVGAPAEVVGQPVDAGQGSHAVSASPVEESRRDVRWPTPEEAASQSEGADDDRLQRDAVEGSRPLAAQQQAVEGSRPLDPVQGSRPMPANGQPPMGGPRRYPQPPYMRGARGGQAPPPRFGRQPGPPGGQSTGSSSGQFPVAPAGQRPVPPPGPPARQRPPARPGQSGPLGQSASSVAPTDLEPRRVPPPERMAQPERVAPPEPALANSHSDGPATGHSDGGGDPAVVNSRPERVPARGRAGSAAPGRSESPIFEEMASAWFRENLQADQAVGSEAASGRSRSAGSGRGESGAWEGAEPLLRPMPESAESNELTTAGLPKRRPRSNLIPGSSGGDDDGVPANVPPRNAEQVRGRLASYQQGVRQGRESKHRRSAADLNGDGRHLHEHYGEENS